MIDRILIMKPEGHKYRIQNLHGEGEQFIEFVQDAPRHEPKPGMIIQDLLRVCIHRLQVLDHEMPFALNRDTIHLLQRAIANQEARALIRHVEKRKLANIELLETDPRDGHLAFEKL